MNRKKKALESKKQNWFVSLLEKYLGEQKLPIMPESYKQENKFDIDLSL